MKRLHLSTKYKLYFFAAQNVILLSFSCPFVYYSIRNPPFFLVSRSVICFMLCLYELRDQVYYYERKRIR